MLADTHRYSRIMNRVDEQRKPVSLGVFNAVLLFTLILVGQTMAQELKWVDSTLAHMTLEEKVGQLFVADFVAVYSHQESENLRRIKRQIEEFHIGGIILAGGAVYDIAVMMNELQRLSMLPLLVAADLESGLGFWHPWRFVRGRAPDLPRFIPGGGTAFPSNMAIGATGNEDYAYEVGRITGLEARAVGIHWPLAPVVDVNNNPRNPIVNTRSFGEDPQLVAKLGAAFVRGCQDAGAIATPKHFPGHGDTEEDSHMRLPILEFDLVRLDSVELVPYKAAIAAGSKSIMSAHIALPKLDPSRRPATLSKPILTSLLREKLKFNGIIVTDGLTMQGITDQYGITDASLLAVQAGADALLVPPDIEAAYKHLLDAVKNGKLSEARIDSSVRRVLAAKAWLGIQESRYVAVSEVMEKVGSPASELTSKRIARDAITLLQNDNRALPISRDKNLKVGVAILSDTQNRDYGRDFLSLLREKYSSVSESYINESTNSDGITEALKRAKRSDVILLPTYVSLGAWKGALRLSAPVKKFIREVSSLKKPVIAISFGDPYIVSEMPRLPGILCAYTGVHTMEQAVVEALRGETDIRGKLPVTIPPRYKRGDGIELRKIQK